MNNKQLIIEFGGPNIFSILDSIENLINNSICTLIVVSQGLDCDLNILEDKIFKKKLNQVVEKLKNNQSILFLQNTSVHKQWPKWIDDYQPKIIIYRFSVVPESSSLKQVIQKNCL